MSKSKPEASSLATPESITLERAVEDLRRYPTVPVWPHVGILLNLSRNSAYEAARRGDIEVIEIGKLRKAISSSLRRRLGIEAA